MTERRGVQGEMPAHMVRPEAVVFDMDGLLLDTERIVLDGFLYACRAHEIPPDPRAYHRCIGTTVDRTRELLLEDYGPDFPYDTIVASWNDYCDEHLVLRPPPLKPGALEVLESVRRLRHPLRAGHLHVGSGGVGPARIGGPRSLLCREGHR